MSVHFGGRGMGHISRMTSLSSGGAITYDYYVDSVGGSDSNAGTQAAPFQTIGRATTALASAGTSMALAKGSYWRESFTVPRTGFTIGVYGSGAPPVLDGADVAGTWVRHADPVTYPDVWQQTWTRTGGSATEYIGVWADGVRPTYQTSVANLQANGGWYASSRTGANPIIYIKSVADPNSSGVLYEISRRNNGIAAHTATIGSTRTLNLTGPLEAKRYQGHYNAIAGSSGTDKRILARDGNIHHMVTEAELTEDVGIMDYYPGYSGYIPLTFYRDVGATYNPVVKRPMILGPGAAVTGMTSAIYAHGSTSRPASLTVQQGYVKDCYYFGSADADASLWEGCYVRSCGQGIANTQPTSIIRNTVFRDPAANGQATNDAGPVDTTVKNWLIENCVIYSSANTVTGAFGFGSRAGTLTIRNCIFVGTPGFPINNLISATPTGAGLAINFSYNVIVNVGQTDRRIFDAPLCTTTSDHNMYIGYQPWFNTNGLGLKTTFASWQSSSGQDLNSSYNSETNLSNMSAYFQGLFADGDFRLKAGLGNFADGVSKNLCGPQTHWDWNARASASGAPSIWPVPPASLADLRTYIADPDAWVF